MDGNLRLFLRFAGLANHPVTINLKPGHSITLESDEHGYLHATDIAFDVPPEESLRVSTHCQTSHAHVHFLDEEGTSVISDIDDTIKVTNISSKLEVLKNTLVRPFVAVPGMAQLYKLWKQEWNANFFYVSSSPWQLYSHLHTFLEQNEFPMGSFYLKRASLHDSTFTNLFTSSKKTKPPIIQQLLERFPKRHFLLVGDDGENDPEIYAKMASEFAKQIKHIYIRCTKACDMKRMEHTFHAVPKQQWTVFEDAHIVK